MRGRKPEARCVVIRNVGGPRIREADIEIAVFGINAQRRTSNFQRPTVCLRCWALGVERWALS